MARLAPIGRGPWGSRKTAARRELGEELDGPDYDPGKWSRASGMAPQITRFV